MKMGFEKFALLYMLLALSLELCSTSSLKNDHFPDAYFQQESGHNLPAYPSFFGYGRSLHFDNNSHKNFKKNRRSLAASVKTINVLNYGAKGDGTTDDSQAFVKAWAEACSSTTDVNFVLPQKKNYFVKQLRFPGPCKSGLTMQISGTMTASNKVSDYSKDLRHWILFETVENLVVSGGGVINGNGKIWWQKSCKTNKNNPCTVAPTAVTFYQCTNLVVKNLKIQNSPQIHTSLEKCTNVDVSNLVVTSPGDSPNTDGIHVTRTKNIKISCCTIATGDDCISIVDGTQMVQVTGITCGPGHGISIGSLGEENSKAEVSQVVVNGAKLSGTTNGVRIKTWQGGSGSASNIKFQNIEMNNVKNAIIIDQNYCDHDEPCEEKSSNVQVKNVLYENIKGTSDSDAAIVFDCSKSNPCEGIVMKNVSLKGGNNRDSKAVCNNVKFHDSSAPFSPSCLFKYRIVS